MRPSRARKRASRSRVQTVGGCATCSRESQSPAAANEAQPRRADWRARTGIAPCPCLPSRWGRSRRLPSGGPRRMTGFRSARRSCSRRFRRTAPTVGRTPSWPGAGRARKASATSGAPGPVTLRPGRPAAGGIAARRWRPQIGCPKAPLAHTRLHMPSTSTPQPRHRRCGPPEQTHRSAARNPRLRAEPSRQPNQPPQPAAAALEWPGRCFVDVAPRCASSGECRRARQLSGAAG
mmetsp:Transcript_32810/g.106024  ORF Transcript_32810/g.106024 Transcript_32810/m.106024 type:complete len:235 (+) Transcript_32810:1121-1825(+)|eukprot:scaffold5448_cov113-Isochrysis_galbana.AAC.3